MQLILNAPKIWFYKGTVDFRRSIDGLTCLVQAELNINPAEGIFVFRNRKQDRLKLLAWHGNGFVLIYKRLEQGKFMGVTLEGELTMTLNEKQLSWLLAGLDWYKMSYWDSSSYDDYY